ncbi:hypothetical protein GOODEAATRI_006283, partial [Goodea atripinnis]
CFPAADIEERRAFMENLLDFLCFYRPVAANLRVRDGEGAGAAGSRPHGECRLGGEIVEWKKGNTGLRFWPHPSSQPIEVSSLLQFELCGVLGVPEVLQEVPGGFPFLQI